MLLDRLAGLESSEALPMIASRPSRRIRARDARIKFSCRR
jgi:hypothetical protein